MKKLFLFAAAAAMFAACTSSDSLGDGQDQSQKSLEPGAVGFEAYTQRATTRAGQADVMTYAKLQASEADGGGFGVFAYYTDNNEYEQSRLPDFMYNQKVIWNSTYWAYEPVKYWPNEYGNNANSDDNDKVSYFAYAPYVQVNPGTGKVVKTNSTDDQWGITGMSRNTVSGDPLIKYIANFESGKNVDLLWGVCDDPNWTIVQGGTVQQINEGKTGLPWLNVERPRIANTQSATTDNQRLKFTFKHALSQLSVNVDAFVDGYNADNALADKTKIYVRSISFTGFALKGALNLNNVDPNTALWMDYNGTGEIEAGVPITIHDGRKDGKEGTAGADATNEKQRGLNPDIISDYNESQGEGNTTPGVTNVARSLFETTSPIMVIPTGEDLEVEIVYDVETEDENLSTKLSDNKTPGSSIENRISKTVSFGSEGMQNGKHYTLNLHLGMNSVKFDATVSAWEEATAKPEADLPLNMPSFQAVTSPSTNEVELSSDAQPYVFAVYGLTPGEPVTATVLNATTGDVLYNKTLDISDKGDFSTTSTVANTSGIAYIRINAGITANATVNKIAAGNGYISVKGGTSNKEVRVSMAQYAAKLGLSVASVDNAANGEIILASNATVAWATDVATADIAVKKNGTTLTYAATPTTATQFGWDAATQKITIGTGIASAIGDVYEITVKAGDADEETYVAGIGGIYFSPNTRSLVYKDYSVSGTYVAYTPLYTGAAPTAYSNVSSTVTGTADVNSATDAAIKTAGVNSGTATTISVTSNQADDAASGWFYTAATKTATYSLTVTKQSASVSFATAPTASTSLTAGTAGVVCSNAANMFATLTGSIDGVLTSSASTGTITYTVDDTTNFEFDGTDPWKLKTKTTTPAATYNVTVTATVTDGTEYSYATNTASYTVTVTVN